MSSEDLLGQAAREALGETRRQCTAISKGTGNRCKRPPIVGGFVCDHHGGKAPQTRAAAKRRMWSFVNPALDAVQRFLQAGPACPHCGRSDGDRDPAVLRAAQLVLDRTGFHPTLAVEGTPLERERPYIAWIPTDRLELLVAWEREAIEAMKRGDPVPVDRDALAAPGDTFDAVLVEPRPDAPVEADPDVHLP